MLTDIPKFIGGARVLFISKSDIGFGSVIRDNNKVNIDFISVCQYDNEDGVYIFGCDNDFNTYTDFYYDDAEEALEDAKRIYQSDEILWTQVN